MNPRLLVGIASCVFLPWSVPIWTSAWLFYKLSDWEKSDASGDGAIVIALLPVLLPIWVYDHTLAKIIDPLTIPRDP